MQEKIQVLFFKITIYLTRFILMIMPEYKPTVFCGKGSSQQLIESIGHLGAKKIMIVTDAVLVKVGVIKPIQKALAAQGIEVEVFDGVEPDPNFSVVDAGIAKMNDSKCDSILAIGGGSSIDAAKVIALAVSSKKTARQVIGLYKGRNKMLPLYAIPTTSGTGSEVTIAAVVSDSETQEKLLVIDGKVVPLMVALDAEITQGMPPHITAATGLDALTHSVESYVSYINDPSCNQYALTACRMIMKNLTKAYDDGKDLDARGAMAIASYSGGIALSKNFLGYVHSIAHQFGGRYHTPHGIANAIILPYVLEFSKPAITDQLAALAKESELGEASDSNAVLADKFIAKIKAMKEHMQIPETLEALKEEDVVSIAEGALEDAHKTYPVPLYMNQMECEQLIRKMLPAA
jgi:alcohol dehydrogenase